MHYWITLLMLLLSTAAGALEQSARLSLVAVATSAGDSANQQGLRWMVGDVDMASEWTLHLRGVRQRSSGATANHASALFRGSALQTDVMGSDASAAQGSVEVDRLFVRHHFSTLSVTLGRQAVEWGAGRFWQPTNLLGSFAPIDLDTAYKPGIDAAILEWYPEHLSSVTLLHTLSPSTEDNSIALHYRRTVGASVEVSLVAGEVVSQQMLGGSITGSWGDLGLRLEGRHTKQDSGEQSGYWIAGVQHQFSDGTLLDLEWYENGRGATEERELAALSVDKWVLNGLQPQLSRNLLAVGVSRDLTPLLQGSYTLLLSRLDDAAGAPHHSLLNQLNLNYSLSDESELLLSALVANGRAAVDGVVQSEFGHRGDSLTLRYHYYF